ncbi:MAG: hypothetical protein AB7V50_08665 [Vampirovibrionia bacterium]
MKDTIKARLLEVSKEVEGKQILTCVEAFKVAEELNVSLKEIGECCNEAEIKLRNCQLGCF